MSFYDRHARDHFDNAVQQAYDALPPSLKYMIETGDHFQRKDQAPLYLGMSVTDADQLILNNIADTDIAGLAERGLNKLTLAVQALNYIVQKTGVKKIRFDLAMVREYDGHIRHATIDAIPVAHRPGLFMPQSETQIHMAQDRSGNLFSFIRHEGKEYIPLAVDRDAQEKLIADLMLRLATHPWVELSAAEWQSTNPAFSLKRRP